MNRRIVAHGVAEKLFEVEASMDETFQKVAEFASYITRARGEANLSAVVGQDVVESLVDTLAKLGSARGALVRTHNNLGQLKDEIGLRHVAIGPTEKPASSPTASLRVVPEAA